MIHRHARCRARADNSKRRGARRAGAALITARGARRNENGRERRGGWRGNKAGRKGAAFVRILPSLYFVRYGLDQWGKATRRARAGPRGPPAGRQCSII